jgi:anti-anti-sigma regulatory factor
MAAKPISIVCPARSLSHTDACRISELAIQQGKARTIVIDLKRVQEATTSGFARLVLLRRRLLRYGGDLRLTGLRDRAALLYGINRLARVLPMI